MACHRFQFLLSHLRLGKRAERDPAPQHDKFAAVREIFEIFNEVRIF
jgi:hypothetical protein